MTAPISYEAFVDVLADKPIPLVALAALAVIAPQPIDAACITTAIIGLVTALIDIGASTAHCARTLPSVFDSAVARTAISIDEVAIIAPL